MRCSDRPGRIEHDNRDDLDNDDNDDTVKTQAVTNTDVDSVIPGTGGLGFAHPWRHRRQKDHSWFTRHAASHGQASKTNHDKP